MASDNAAILESRRAQPADQLRRPAILPPAPTTDRPAGSPEWWVVWLEQCLAAQQREIAKADRYYNGQQDTMFITAKYQDAFGSLLSALVENWMPLVVDALRERLVPTGFRIPQPEQDAKKGVDPGRGDEKAWSIWQANDLDAESQLAHTEALIKGKSFALVNPFVDDEGWPEITIEDATQMVVMYDQGNRRRVAAALKVWTDLYGATLGTLYLPNQIYKFTRSRGVASGIVLPPGSSVSDWAPREVNGESWPLEHDLDVVPVVPLENRPRLLSCGESELAQVMTTQDAINKVIADMMVAGEFAAFRQRYLIGVKIDKDPISGKAKSPFESAADRLFQVENPEAKFGEFEATDLSNYTNVKKSFIESISARTRIPTHYFGLVGQWPSGEALQAAEAGLVSKALEKMLFFGDGWEKVIRIAFRALDDPRGKVLDSETLWRNPERRTASGVADAAVKKGQVGVPWEQLMIDLDYSPQEIARMVEMRKEEADRAPVITIPAPVPGGVPSNGAAAAAD